MFLLNVRNVHANDEVDTAAAVHLAWLKRHFDSGVFIAAGPKIPRTGGIIVGQGLNRNEIEDLVANSPFVHHGHVTMEIIEFKVLRVADGIALSPNETARS
jgi:uncharacterized protein YciI